MSLRSSGTLRDGLNETHIPKTFKNKVTLIILSLVAISMIFYGFLALDMARVNSLPLYDDSVLSDRLKTAEQVKTDDKFKAGLEEAGHSGIWMALMSNATSGQYAYDDKGLYETFLYYANMSTPQVISISLHNALGGICIILGGLQFLPGLRRKAPTLHRRIGKTYVTVVYGAMFLAIFYLLITPVDDIFAGLTFAFGLWMMATLTLFSLTMAIYHAMKKEIAQHQAYMALNYSILLSAPLLRYDWTLMGMFLPIEKSFMEGHFSIIILLLPHCVLSGYLIFSLNRWVQNDRPSVKAAELGNRLGGWILNNKSLWPYLGAMLAGFIGYNFLYLFEAGGKSAGIELFPESFISYETGILKPLVETRLLFVATSIFVFFIGAIFLQKQFSNKVLSDRSKRMSLIFGIGLGGFGMALCELGYNMGLPGWQSLGGGTFYFMVGVITLLFAMLQLINMLFQRWDYVRECMVLGYATALSIPTFDILLVIMPIFNMTEQHVAEGHGYEITAAASFISLVLAFLYVTYGRPTASKFAR